MGQAQLHERQTSGDGVGTDVDVVFDILSNRRRRFVLHYLLQQDRVVELRELSSQVTAWENDIDVEDVTYTQRKRVYTALRQTHLPTMDDAGVVLFDSRAGSVEPTATAREFDIYVDVVPGNEIPWSQYYLGLGLLFCAAVLCVTFVPFPPFTMVSDLGLVAVIAVGLTVSAALHSYLDYQRRLGSDGLPPESRVE